MNKLTIIIIVLLCPFWSAAQNDKIIQFGLGYYGGDGQAPSRQLVLSFSKKVKNKLSVYGIYTFNRSKNLTLYQDVDSKHFGPNHEGGEDLLKIFNWVSLGAGVELIARESKTSYIYGKAGLRYVKLNESSLFSGSSDRVLTSIQQEEFLGIEFGFGYRKIFSNHVILGGEVSFFQPGLFMGGSVSVGYLF